MSDRFFISLHFVLVLKPPIVFNAEDFRKNASNILVVVKSAQDKMQKRCIKKLKTIVEHISQNSWSSQVDEEQGKPSCLRTSLFLFIKCMNL